eukprot:SAG31_NODE_447_length_15579_cov_5.713871_3_plen_131_part_00
MFDFLVCLPRQTPGLQQKTGMRKVSFARVLEFGHNDKVGGVGFIAIAEALPEMPALEHMVLNFCKGMGPAGALAIASALASCTQLSSLDMAMCGIGKWDTMDAAVSEALHTGWGTRPGDLFLFYPPGFQT